MRATLAQVRRKQDFFYYDIQFKAVSFISAPQQFEVVHNLEGKSPADICYQAVENIHVIAAQQHEDLHPSTVATTANATLKQKQTSEELKMALLEEELEYLKARTRWMKKQEEGVELDNQFKAKKIQLLANIDPNFYAQGLLKYDDVSISEEAFKSKAFN